MKRLLALFAAVFIAAASHVYADVTLVKNGVPNAEIVVGKNPTRSTGLGAFELQFHIQKITGTRLSIVEKPTGKVPVRIFIGGNNKGFTGERIVRRFKGNDIILTGNDTSARKPVNYQDHKTFPFADAVNEYGYNGPLFAVYDFLEDLCGVRFFFMNDKGTACPQTRTLTVESKDRDHTPKFDAFRVISTNRSRDPKLAGSMRDLRLWTLRWRLAQFYGRTNHNGYSIYFQHWGKAKRKTLAPTFKEKRKEYFAQGYDGQGPMGDPIIRNNYANDKDCPAQLCYSNPGTINYFANEALIYAKGGSVKGGWMNFSGKYSNTDTLLPRFAKQPYFYPVEPGDTAKDKVCLCPDCRKRVSPGAADISDHKFRFVSDIANKIAETDPTVGVSSLAYIRSLDYPEKTKLAKNLSVQLCLPIYSWWHPVAYQKQYAAYKKWAVKEAGNRPLTLWIYMFTSQYDADVHFGKYKSFPGFYPSHTIDLYKEFAADGMRGWFAETVKTHMFMECYLAARICYDNTKSKEEMLNDYYTKCYGKAAPSVRAFYEEIEKAYWNPENCPKEWLKDPNVLVGPKGVKHPYWSTGLWSQDVAWNLGTKERMKKLNDLMIKAEKDVDTPQGKYMLTHLRKIWNDALEGHTRYYEFAKLKRNRSLLIQPVSGANGDPRKINWKNYPVSEEFTDSEFRKVARKCTFQTVSDDQWVYFRFHENAAPAKGETILSGQGVEMAFSADGDYPIGYVLLDPSGKSNSVLFNLESDVRRHKKFDYGLKYYSIPGKNSWTALFAMKKDRLPIKTGKMSMNMIRVRPNKDYAVWNAAGSYDCTYKLDDAGNLLMLPYTIRSDKFRYVNESRTRQEKDPASGNGFAGSMDFGYSWGMQAYPPAIFTGVYDVDVYLRASEFPKGTSFKLVVHDNKRKKTVLIKNVPRSLVSGKKEFAKITLQNVELNETTYIGITGFNKKVTVPGKVYMEKVVIRKEKK